MKVSSGPARHLSRRSVKAASSDQGSGSGFYFPHFRSGSREALIDILLIVRLSKWLGTRMVMMHRQTRDEDDDWRK